MIWLIIGLLTFVLVKDLIDLILKELFPEVIILWGPRGSGKTTFVEAIKNYYKQGEWSDWKTLRTEAIEEKVITLKIKGEEKNFKIFDCPGELWRDFSNKIKEKIADKTLFFYFFDVQKFKENRDYKERVDADLRLLGDFFNKDSESYKKKLKFLLIGTHVDTDKDYKKYKDNYHGFLEHFEKQFEKSYLPVKGVFKDKFGIVLGSLIDKEEFKNFLERLSNRLRG